MNGQWKRLEAIYVDPGDHSTMLAVFAAEAARLLLFVESGKPNLGIVQSEDHPRMVRVILEDLNGDHRPEWLLEIASRYGDGFYSTLWHVDAGGRPIFHPFPCPAPPEKPRTPARRHPGG